MSTRTLANPKNLGLLDLADPVTHADHDLSEVWGHLREHEPVFWHRSVNGRPGFWVLTRHADVSTVYLDNRNFTSANGNVLATLLLGGDPASGTMAAVSDGHRHAGIRSILLKVFTPRALEGVVEELQENTRRLLQQVATGQVIDFAQDVAAHIPLTTICDLLGVPPDDRGFLYERATTALGSESAEQSPVEVWQARNDILGYFDKLADQRRQRPGDDAVSVLATSTLDGKKLTKDEIVTNCYSLILGGDETSRLSMVGAVLAYTEHPAQWQALKRGDVELSKAVEEVLRWTTPAIHFGRTAVADVEINGTNIRSGDIVTLWNSSANMDPTVFDDPTRFDLGRSPNKHISFGKGPHFCLGAYLGRAEIRAMLHSLREVVSEIDVAGEPRRLYSNLLSGMSSLPVKLKPAADSRDRPATGR